MILYELYDMNGDEAPCYFFPTLKTAREAAVEWNLGWFKIDRVEIVKLPPRELACRLLSGESFVIDREPMEGRGGV